MSNPALKLSLSQEKCEYCKTEDVVWEVHFDKTLLHPARLCSSCALKNIGAMVTRFRVNSDNIGESMDDWYHVPSEHFMEFDEFNYE